MLTGHHPRKLPWRPVGTLLWRRTRSAINCGAFRSVVRIFLKYYCCYFKLAVTFISWNMLIGSPAYRRTHYQHFKYRWGTREMLLEEEQHLPLPLEKERRWEHVPWKLNQISNREDQLPKDLGFKFLIRIFTCFHCFVWHRFA